MIVVVVPRPNAPYWPGRRRLAAIDAVSWPLVCVMLVHRIPNAGNAAFMLTAAAGLWACLRLYRAIFNNHRYWFTNWLVARVLGLLFFFALLMRLALWVAPLIK